MRYRLTAGVATGMLNFFAVFSLMKNSGEDLGTLSSFHLKYCIKCLIETLSVSMHPSCTVTILVCAL